MKNKITVILGSKSDIGKLKDGFVILDELGVIGSYTIINRSYTNIGAGVYYNYAPVQVYLVTDNIVGLFVPDAVKYANVHFGINLFLPSSKSGDALIEF